MDKAAGEFKTELARFPNDAVSNCLLGQIVRKQGDFARAAKYFSVAAAANPKYEEALLGLGQSELALNDAAGAVAPLEQAVKLAPESVEAHYVLGTALRKLGRKAEAGREQALSAQLQVRQRERYAKKLSGTAH